jgi:hypothetical protein
MPRTLVLFLKSRLDEWFSQGSFAGTNRVDRRLGFCPVPRSADAECRAALRNVGLHYVRLHRRCLAGSFTLRPAGSSRVYLDHSRLLTEWLDREAGRQSCASCGTQELQVDGGVKTALNRSVQLGSKLSLM